MPSRKLPVFTPGFQKPNDHGMAAVEQFGGDVAASVAREPKTTILDMTLLRWGGV